MSVTTYATGRRKNAVARVYIKPGTGKFMVNKREVLDYFKRATLKMDIEQPLELSEALGSLDIIAFVNGGGLSGQAGALRHGLSRALLKSNPDLKEKLRAAGFLTRDSRMVERKKYGQKKARKRFQFSKR
jgi:small subunit ribosomal protein S9